MTDEIKAKLEAIKVGVATEACSFFSNGDKRTHKQTYDVFCTGWNAAVTATIEELAKVGEEKLIAKDAEIERLKAELTHSVNTGASIAKENCNRIPLADVLPLVSALEKIQCTYDDFGVHTKISEKALQAFMEKYPQAKVE